MKRLLGIVLAAVSITAAAEGVVYDGEFYADTKASASSRSPWVHPTNVVGIADKRIENYWENVLRPLYMPPGLSAINIYNSDLYPSSVHGSFNINLGIDNVTGDETQAPSKSAYSTTIGTSAKALGMHSYAYGSQINAIAGSTTVIGYGASATSEWSTVIGHGRRPSTNGSTYDKNFTTDDDMRTWLRTFSYDVFKGVHFKSPDGTLYTITGIRDSVDSQGYWYDFVETPGDWDYVPGGYDWRYGKSHGKGTFNIVAYGMPGYTTFSPGLRAVYINDDCLADLIKQGDVLILTPSQLARGVTFVKDGYYQNSAVEIGADAKASLNQSYVSSYTSTTPLRNVGVAIGARADATNPSTPGTSQGVAVGYCARAKGGQSIAIGPGAKHLSGSAAEDDNTGNNAVAAGGTSIAIGYNTKAYGEKSVAIGSGNGGTVIASNKCSVAVGFHAVAAAEGAVQIGEGINASPNTLQFQDVQIVKDGKLVALDTDFMAPKEVDPGADGEVSVKTGNQITLMPETPFNEGSEIAIEPEGSRNYTVYIPNEPEVREGMPAWLGNELPEGIRCVYNNTDDCFLKLPVRVTVSQPYSKLVIVESEYLDDGEDWTPVVTNCNWVYNNDDANPALVLKEGATYAIEGIKLHAATNVTVTYIAEGGVTKTVNVDTGSTITTKKGITFMSGTYFKGLRLNELKLPLNRRTDEPEFTIKYYTLNGTSVFTKSLL